MTSNGRFSVVVVFSCASAAPARRRHATAETIPRVTRIMELPPLSLPPCYADPPRLIAGLWCRQIRPPVSWNEGSLSRANDIAAGSRAGVVKGIAGHQGQAAI